MISDNQTRSPDVVPSVIHLSARNSLIINSGNIHIKQKQNIYDRN